MPPACTPVSSASPPSEAASSTGVSSAGLAADPAPSPRLSSFGVAGSVSSEGRSSERAASGASRRRPTARRRPYHEMQDSECHQCRSCRRKRSDRRQQARISNESCNGGAFHASRQGLDASQISGVQVDHRSAGRGANGVKKPFDTVGEGVGLIDDGISARSLASVGSYCECFLQADWCRSWSDPQAARPPLQKPEWHVRAAPKPRHGQRPDLLRRPSRDLPQPPAAGLPRCLPARPASKSIWDVPWVGVSSPSGSPLSNFVLCRVSIAGAISFSPAAGRGPEPSSAGSDDDISAG